MRYVLNTIASGAYRAHWRAYNHHGFIGFASATMSLYLPLAKAAHAMGLDPKIGRA